MAKVHTVTSKTTGKVYEVAKIRSPDSFYLPVYHCRRAGSLKWDAMDCDTLAQVRAELHA